MKTIVITGHRDVPEHVAHVLEKSLTRLRGKDYHQLVSGMAPGVDLMGAEIALDLGYAVLAVVPHFGHEFRMSSKNQKRYWNILRHPKTKVEWSNAGAYERGSFLKRNIYMVHKMGAGDILMAVMSDQKSGTGHCVNCARKEGKSIYLYNPETKKWNKENV